MNMSRKNQEIPAIQLDGELDRETARQIVEGTRDFATRLRDAHTRGAADLQTEAFMTLFALVDQVLLLDLSLPIGLKLGLQSIRREQWKKPWEDLKKSISHWQPKCEKRYERLIQPFDDMNDASKEWKVGEKERQKQFKKDQQVWARISSDVDRVLSFLAQMSQVAELRLLGKTAVARPRKRSDAPKNAEACLAEYCAKFAWMIDYLSEGINAGDLAAARLAKRQFGRNVLAARLGIAEGTLSKTKVYARLKTVLRLNERYGVRLKPVTDAQIDATSETDSDSEDVQLLLERLDRCKESTVLTPELDVALRRQIRGRPDLHSEIEQLLDNLERGENPFAPAALPSEG